MNVLSYRLNFRFGFSHSSTITNFLIVKFPYRPRSSLKHLRLLITLLETRKTKKEKKHICREEDSSVCDAQFVQRETAFPFERESDRIDTRACKGVQAEGYFVLFFPRWRIDSRRNYERLRTKEGRKGRSVPSVSIWMIHGGSLHWWPPPPQYSNPMAYPRAEEGRHGRKKTWHLGEIYLDSRTRFCRKKK